MNYIDLFAGAGGLSEGFIREGFTPVTHIEMEEGAVSTLRTRVAFHHLKNAGRLNEYEKYLRGETSRAQLWNSIPPDQIGRVLSAEICDQSLKALFKAVDGRIGAQSVDLILGGPPCQAYSLVGRSRDPHGMKGDRRNFLFRFYAQFLKRYKPKIFVFENVLGLLTAGNANYFNQMLKLFNEVGYSISTRVLNAEEYGVMQKRKRVVIIGRKGKRSIELPEIPKIENHWQVANDLFFDLPRLDPGQELSVAKYSEPNNLYLSHSGIRNGEKFVTQHITRDHNDRDLEIYALAIDKWLNRRERLKYCDIPSRLQTHRNKIAFLDRYKVVDPLGRSHTIVAHIAKDGHYYIYPDANQVRSLSVREAARIQSFPDDFYFEGGRTSAFRQIGNAVPPLMAHAISRVIKDMM